MVPGRSKGGGFTTWLASPPNTWRERIEIVAMDGVTGCKSAAAEELPGARAVMDLFHNAHLAGDGLDECRRRTGQELHHRRGRATDPLYKARRMLHTRSCLLTLRQQHQTRPPLYTWEPLSPTSGSEPDMFADLATASESQADGAPTASSLDFSRPIGDQIPVILDGYRRVDNVTDATLASYREHYGDAGITKEDIFFYVYALLHHPVYRERYADDLKKMLPHIPRAAGFHTYAGVGRELADLHVNYERVESYPSVQEEASLHAPADPWERYKIAGEMSFRQVGRKRFDYTEFEYNKFVSLTGIPEEAQRYTVSQRSPLEWIIDRYHVKTDKASGIVNDPNDFLREQGCPDAVVDLIKRLVTVSMRTQELLATLPALEIPEQ